METFENKKNLIEFFIPILDYYNNNTLFPLIFLFYVFLFKINLGSLVAHEHGHAHTHVRKS